MDIDNICLHCMEEKGTAERCLFCNNDQRIEKESLLHLSPGTVLQGKCLLGRALGQGGFGITYLAYDLTLDLKLAIKEYMPQHLATRSGSDQKVAVYKQELQEEYRYGLNSFLKEARTLACFNEHPNIVTVRDYFEDKNTAYLIMNYHQGITLQAYLEQRGGKIPVDQALEIVMPVLDALKEIHASGILHRDISPDNLLIGEKGRVILIDFGAARQAVSEQSKSISVIMKAGFSPPEQYQSRGKQGPWTDIYAVAATMYCIITGQAPLEAIDRMAADDLIPPSQLGISIDRGLEYYLLKALAVKAEDRYQTVEEFQVALMALETEAVASFFLADEPEQIENDEDIDLIETTIIIEQWEPMRLIIPAIDVDLICVGGGDVFDEELLSKGPTHFQMSDLPSTEKGNVAFAGHRAGRWDYFLDLDLLEEGNEILLDVEDGYRFIYLVEWVEITDKFDWGPIYTTDYPAITLQTTEPKHVSNPEYRLNVRGKLDKVTRIPED